MKYSHFFKLFLVLLIILHFKPQFVRLNRQFLFFLFFCFFLNVVLWCFKKNKIKFILTITTMSLLILLLLLILIFKSKYYIILFCFVLFVLFLLLFARSVFFLFVFFFVQIAILRNEMKNNPLNCKIHNNLDSDSCRNMKTN